MRRDKGRVPIHIGQIRELVHGRCHALFRPLESAFAGGVVPIHRPEPVEGATEVPLMGDDLSARPLVCPPAIFRRFQPQSIHRRTAVFPCWGEGWYPGKRDETNRPSPPA